MNISYKKEIWRRIDWKIGLVGRRVNNPAKIKNQKRRKKSRQSKKTSARVWKKTSDQKIIKKRVKQDKIKSSTMIH